MSKQQQTRDALRLVWADLLARSLPGALEVAQTEAAATAVVAILWPAMRPDDLALLDQDDPAFLQRGPAIPDGFALSVEAELAKRAEGHLRTMFPDNRHARGGDLRRLVSAEVDARLSAIRDAAHQLFDARENDRFCSPAAIRTRVLVHLSDLVLDELRQFEGADEAEAKRKLKILTALVTSGGSRAERHARLRGIRDGSTGSFPYILRYLNRGVCPSLPTFPSGLPITLSGFCPELEAKFPEARHVRICLDRYQQRQGVICRFIDPDGPVSPGLEQMYAAKPPFAELPGSGLVVPKADHLAAYKRDFLRMPDGVVCAVSLGVLLESLLRQAVSALGLGGGPNMRGSDLAPNGFSCPGG
jgi:hypothetical protein